MSRTSATTGNNPLIVPQGPSNPTGISGQLFINTSSNILEIFYAGTWQTIMSLVTTVSELLLQDSTALLLQDGTPLELNS